MAGKITKKELKEPDFLQVEFAKLMQFIKRHQSKFYIVLMLHLLGLAAAAGWYLYKLNYEKSASRIYNEAEKLAIKSGSAQNQIAKLIEGFRNVAFQYPRSQAALHSYYQLANLYLNANQIDLAIRTYDEFINRAPDSNNLKVFAYTGKGYCYEIKKDYKKALSSFETAMKMPDGAILQGQIYRDMARVYEAMNDKNKSVEYYRKALEKITDPTMESIVKRKIAALS